MKHLAQTSPTRRSARIPWILLVIASIALALAIGIVAASAAISKSFTDGHIVVRVVDVTTTPGLPLNDVAVTVGRVTAGATGCSGQSGASGPITDPRNSKSLINGAVLFSPCRAGSGAGAGYVITGTTKPGYIVAPHSPHPINTGVFHLKAGKLRKRTAVVNLYMQTDRNPLPTPISCDTASPPNCIYPQGEPQPGSPLDLTDTDQTDSVDDISPATLRSTGGTSPSFSPSPEPVPAADRPKAAAAVRISLTQLGITENPVGSNCVAGNKYRNGTSPGCQAWCAFYLTWVWQQAGVNVPTIGSTSGVQQWGSSRGLYHSTRSGYAPRPGDAVLFGPAHVGMVSSVEGGKIRIISGNWGQKVSRNRSSSGNNLDFPRNFTAVDNGTTYHVTGFVSPEK